jgi:hypothetical protein
MNTPSDHEDELTVGKTAAADVAAVGGKAKVGGEALFNPAAFTMAEDGMPSRGAACRVRAPLPDNPAIE